MLTQLSPRELRALKLDRLRLKARRVWLNWPIIAMLAAAAAIWDAAWQIYMLAAQ